MLNAIYHFDMDEAFSPYAGYGISTAFHEASLEGFSDGPHRAFAYQSKVEIGLNLSQNMGLLIGHRFFSTDNQKPGFLPVK